ncbi:MAG: hypothetical protein IPN34_24770 [Planctomycetes bacterium]|nr:hypothetical protein [Planctomycetota bacterium]
MPRTFVITSAFALGLSLATPVCGQQPFLVTTASGGRVTVNEATLYQFDGSAGGDLQDQAVVGPDLFHLRGDGVVWKNGLREFENPVAVGGTGRWIKIAADDVGNIFCLESSGRQTQRGAVIADLPNDGNLRTYVDLEFADDALWSLRDDGKVYRGGVEFYAFGSTPTSSQTRFISLTVDPSRSQLYALRRDGEIWRGQITTIPSTPDLIADYPTTTPQEEWMDLAFETSGNVLWAIRRDGVVFRMPIPGGSGIAYVVYPGDGIEGGKEFRSIVLLGDEPLAVRYDGRIYRDLSTTELCDLQGNGYVCFDLTLSQPVSDNAKIFKPVISTYTTTCYVGDPVDFPVLVSSTSTESFTFTPVEVPAWGTFDTQTNPPTFSGTPNAAGSFTFSVEINDGLNQPKVAKWKINVKESDTDPAKNQKPKFQKLKKVQALTGIAIVIPLRAYDADGDTLTYTVGEMPEGMVFDDGSQSGTPSLSWTPPICAGDWKVEIQVTDGTKGQSVKGKVQIETATPIW